MEIQKLPICLNNFGSLNYKQICIQKLDAINKYTIALIIDCVQWGLIATQSSPKSLNITQSTDKDIKTINTE